ncbi:LD-carboxypeptidase [Sphingosinicella rhizophila]|uniref:LD-carboxypeptidase n=1 Tax=Sphingosinicella rhizophila TaxID=3050082 RepID=A0ABU3Q483_9SPHN|nr:LD-carboxypeptidase [Sphingosinicella sp. GR2756]MDT9598230.1 LD-carboxypeptidase [Sphingosinicella sp. GR2756]
MRIGVVAPSSPLSAGTADRVIAIAAASCPGVTLHFHPQCFLAHNHFAGPDEVRADAFVDYANDPEIDAIWFARGGYGACRIAETAIERLGDAARGKAYLGYSDAGFLLAGLYRAGFPRLAHGPMPQDVHRDGGDMAVLRALSWLAGCSPVGMEAAPGDGKAVAFNLTVFSQLLGTALEPDLEDHVLMLEEVSEYMYRIDRSMFHVASNFADRGLSGIRLGRCSDVLANDPDFGETEEQVVRFWCRHAGIPYLGRADIGHDADNKIVPFGSS